MAGLVLALLAAPQAAEARSPELRVTPGLGQYVGGQAVTFTGNIGLAGSSRIHLQRDGSNGRNPWVDVPGSYQQTAADGSFSFTLPAPAMFGLRLRVVTSGAATPAVTFKAQSQELTLAVDEPDLPAGEVRAGQQFRIHVDTTPVVWHRPDATAPALPGRTVRLQQRVAGYTWQDVATGGTAVTDKNGQADFVQTVDGSQGDVTYRAVQEDYKVGGSEIGWFPSFPYTVRVQGHPAAGTTSSTMRTTTIATSRAARAARTAHGATASKTYRWGPPEWDFAWEYGESLTSLPFRGLNLRGAWLDSSDGSGRVSPHNGQLTLDSNLAWEGPGDHGTTRATLASTPMRLGRWETKMRLARAESGAGDYHAVIELVPDGTTGDACGPRITVADVPAFGSTVGFGVRSASGREWSATRQLRLGSGSANFGIEVARKHLTWFIDGRPMGTVKTKSAVPRVPMTLRLSLVGRGAQEMNHTMFHSDWQRSWSLRWGKQVATGGRLAARTVADPC